MAENVSNNYSSSDQAAPPAMPACPVCFTRDAGFFAMGRDRLFHLAPGRYALYRCLSCRCVFQHPVPREDAIRGFYPETYWWGARMSQEQGPAALLRRLERSYREFVATDHVRFLERCARGSGAGERTLLDIGCGSGLFLDLARRRGFVSHGMDVSQRAVDAVREQYGIDVRRGAVGDDIWKGRRFDFVTMFHVLEHLTDPRAAIRYARAQIKPGGGLIVQVPNLSSLQSRVFGRRWYGLDVPRHIVNFTPGGLQLLLQETGFRIQDTARFSLRDNPASIASSLVPALDPIGRSGRGFKTGALAKAMMEFGYLGLVLLCTPFALCESAMDLGGTIWVYARPAEGSK